MNAYKEKLKDEILSQVNDLEKYQIEELLENTKNNIESQNEKIIENFRDNVDYYINIIHKLKKLNQKAPEVKKLSGEQKEITKGNLENYRKLVKELKEKQDRIESLKLEISYTKKYIKYFTDFSYINDAIERDFFYIVYKKITEFQNNMHPLLNTEPMYNMKILSEKILVNNTLRLRKIIEEKREELKNDISQIGREYWLGNRKYVFEKYYLVYEYYCIAKQTGDTEFFRNLFKSINFRKESKKDNALELLGTLYLKSLFEFPPDMIPEIKDNIILSKYGAISYIRNEPLKDLFEFLDIVLFIEKDFKLELNFEANFKTLLKVRMGNLIDSKSIDPAIIESENEIRIIKTFKLIDNPVIGMKTDFSVFLLDLLDFFGDAVDMSISVFKKYDKKYFPLIIFIFQLIDKQFMEKFENYRDSVVIMSIVRMIYESGVTFIRGVENYLSDIYIDEADKVELNKEKEDFLNKRLESFKKGICNYMYLFFNEIDFEQSIRDCAYRFMMDYSQNPVYYIPIQKHKESVSKSIVDSILCHIFRLIIESTKPWTVQRMEDLVLCLDELMEWEVVGKNTFCFSRLKGFLEMLINTKNGSFTISSPNEFFSGIDPEHKKVYLSILSKYGSDNISESHINDLMNMVQSIN